MASSAAAVVARAPMAVAVPTWSLEQEDLAVGALLCSALVLPFRRSFHLGTTRGVTGGDARRGLCFSWHRLPSPRRLGPAVLHRLECTAQVCRTASPGSLLPQRLDPVEVPWPSLRGRPSVPTPPWPPALEASTGAAAWPWQAGAGTTRAPPSSGTAPPPARQAELGCGSRGRSSAAPSFAPRASPPYGSRRHPHGRGGRRPRRRPGAAAAGPIRRGHLLTRPRGGAEKGARSWPRRTRGGPAGHHARSVLLNRSVRSATTSTRRREAMARREGRWPMGQLEGMTAARGAREGGCWGASASVRAEAGRRSKGGGGAMRREAERYVRRG
ncbi:hypothetical protein PVAP13_4NG165311 [Panicum virgatum]|uniref:Uncharacterized protein n=1 Tax=Panicum virgatum TaxID=38727 RepID=A0A8T0T500_PANVG|nr:hypothetical protein PVAP13_4NG165311 [Panicum virgatum]